MKYLILIGVSVLLSACSSMNYIQTHHYESLVADRCLSKIESPTKQQKAQCSIKSSSKVNFAYRMYEIRAKQDYNVCVKENDKEENQDACFKEKQRQYYDQYFNVEK